MRKIIILVFSVFGLYNTFGQNYIQSAFPLLNNTNNARIAGFGDIASVSSTFYKDAGLYQNPALLAKNTEYWEGHVSYKSLNENVYLLEGAGIYGFNNKHAIGFKVKDLDYGEEIEWADYDGNIYQTGRLYEMCVQINYCYTLNPKVSFGGSVKYFNSNNIFGISAVPTSEKNRINTFAIDLGFNYDGEINISGYRIPFNTGLNISNFGPKCDYSFDGKSFQSTILQAGFLISPEIKLSEKYSLCIDAAYQAEKYLVPTPPVYSEDGIIIDGKDPDISVFRALYQSFYDAPGGFSEEFHEINHKIGNEVRLSYKQDIHYSFRWGMFREHKTKGERRYTTLGIGWNVYGVTFDVVKIISKHFFYKNTWGFSVGVRSDFNKLFSNRG